MPRQRKPSVNPNPRSAQLAQGGALANVPIANLAKQLAKVDTNLSAQQIENLAQGMKFGLTEGLREKQIEKA